MLPGNDVFDMEWTPESGLREVTVLTTVASAPADFFRKLTHAWGWTDWRAFDCQYARRSLTLM